MTSLKSKKSEKPQESHRFYTNHACKYFPCHPTENPDEFNCLFCFCPAYALGKDCGGRFSYENEEGYKDCSGCSIPHQKDSYEWMMVRSKMVAERLRK